MRRAVTLVLILLTLAFFLWLRWGRVRSGEQATWASIAPGRSPLTISSPKTPNVQADPVGLQKPGGPDVSSDPRWAIVRQKDRVDRNWEWKVPINFYGRVVDVSDKPIPAARVDFSWTDLSPAGNSTGATLSGPDGVFTLEGKTGRVLQVDVSKDGFYKVRSERLKSFDYAGFWEKATTSPILLTR